MNQELAAYINHLEDAREREAITAVFNVSRLGNQLMQHNTPWKLVKGSAEDKARAGTVVGLSVNMAALLSVLIQPYMPNMAANLENQLAVPKGRLTRQVFLKLAKPKANIIFFLDCHELFIAFFLPGTQ